MSIGIWQLILILLIVFVIFGAGKLPRVMGDLGKGARALKKGLKEEDTPEIPTQTIDASSQEHEKKDS